MQAEELFRDLYANREIYKQLHNRTAEMDLKIIELFSKGKNAVQIAMEVPCSEATVYRAKIRAEQFLNYELPRHNIKVSNNIYMHNAIVRGIWNLDFQSCKLYHMLVHAYQNFKDYVEGKTVHLCIPGLRNQVQREVVLIELNNFTVLLDKTPKRSIKIFEYVIYDQAKYSFKFTKEALPYHDMFYALLGMMGAEDFPE